MEKILYLKNYRESNAASSKAKSDCEDIFPILRVSKIWDWTKNITNSLAGKALDLLICLQGLPHDAYRKNNYPTI